MESWRAVPLPDLGEWDGSTFAMFRRAKPMLADLPDASADRVVALVDLTDERGMPRAARLRSPSVRWQVEPV